jgi:predicted Zn-dependent protease with MMP-like domain
VSSRRRDRRGRGLRGPLAPPDSPLSLTRAEQFDEMVLDGVEDLEDAWAEALDGVDIAVEDVPPAGGGDGPEGPLHPLPLGRTFPATAGAPARIVVYRRPVEVRAAGRRARAALVHDVLVELLAELLGLEPETVDPDYPESEGWA